MSAASDAMALKLQRWFDYVYGDRWEDTQGVTHNGPVTPCHEHEAIVEWSETHKESARNGKVLSRHFVHPPHPCPEITIPLDAQGSARGLADTSGARPQAHRKRNVHPSGPVIMDLEAAGRGKAEASRKWDRGAKRVKVLTTAILKQQAMSLGIR